MKAGSKKKMLKSDFVTTDFKDELYFNNVKQCLIYPENNKKNNWDLFVTMYSILFILKLYIYRLLLFTCVLTPYNIAF